ncbi:MAG: hypothetical protein WCX31_20035 [Salinivirgaceae bacterium]|jgi:Spy/CpxP family protein refolding chaperone
MNIIYKNKLLLWAVIVLVAINLGTLSTFWITSFGNERNKENSNYRKNRMDKGILVKELNLHDEQVLFYQNERKIHFVKIHLLRDEIDKYQRLIREELFSYNPDTSRMNNYADSIGILNARFEKANLIHFTNIKKQLTPEQCKRFQNLMDKNLKRPERGEQRHYHKNRD